MKVKNYVLNKWVEGDGEGTPLLNAFNDEVIRYATTKGLDLDSIFDYGRNVGSVNLRKIDIHKRANILKKLAVYLGKHKEEFYSISYYTGATRLDSWIDIEGGLSNLFVYSSKGRRELPDKNFFLDGETENISKNGTFIGQHMYLPKRGVAVHINAFNFPVWGMLEKISVNLLAGVACIVKPAEISCYLTEAVVKRIIESKILPEGSLQLISGSCTTILDYVNHSDVVTFTGSAKTGQLLKQSKSVIKENVRFNMETDSLNCIILGEDSAPNTVEFKLFIKEIIKEMTIKSGQKCTAIRRVIVPETFLPKVKEELIKALNKITCGDPRNKNVKMGSLASKSQRKEVIESIEQLKKENTVIYQNHIDLVDIPESKGSFFPCTLLLSEENKNQNIVHEIEAFGPVSTLIPYKNINDAITIANKGKGSLVASVVSYDKKFIYEVVHGIGIEHGRVLVLDRDCAEESTGHGSPLPHLIHGGPGRAGGGEEMGGIRGVKYYMQKTALQGTPDTITTLSGVYQDNAQHNESKNHPFSYFYDDLQIGQSLFTHKRTITEADIVNFANVSGDNFYVHTDITSLDGTIFKSRAAHGYFILSAAAGLFVNPKKGPVLANYGIDFCRFLQPVYVNDTISVRLTCKEKINKNAKNGEQPSGVVKWRVQIMNQNNETVTLATILTLVAKKGEDFIEFSKKEISNALSLLDTKAKPLWGTMTPADMVSHLSYSVKVSIGKEKVLIHTAKEMLDSYQTSLFNNVAMVKNFNMPGYKKMDLPQTESYLKNEIENLIKGIEDFFEYYNKNPQAVHANIIYGELNFKQWVRLHTKHFTHHLKQFKLI